MDDFVDVEVRNADQSVYRRDRYQLPITIGRGAGTKVQLDPTREDISRVHCELTLSSGRLFLRDKSANGTDYRGRRLRNGEGVELRDSDTFSILGYTISVSRARREPGRIDFYTVLRTQAGLERERFGIGQSMLVCLKQADRLRFHEVPRDANLDSVFGNYRLEGKQPLFVVYSERKHGFLEVSKEGIEYGFELNRSPVRDRNRPLDLLDVILIGAIRIEIVLMNERALRCKNLKCTLLNPYDKIHDNCRWCGHRLHEGTTSVITGDDHADHHGHGRGGRR